MIIKFLIILFVIASLVALIFVLVTKTSKFEGLVIPLIKVDNVKGICTDCQFIQGMKDYSNMKCTPTDVQLNVINDMDSYRIKYCGENICLPEMQNILLNCFTSINNTCSDCNFIDLLDQPCMVNAYSNITDLYDNDKTRLQKRLYVSNNCGCTPKEEQIDLFNTLVNNNINSDDSYYLLNCQTDGCFPEMDNISTKCLNEKYEDCLDCEFLTKIFTGCVVDAYTETNFERKNIFAKSCRCIPSESQLNVLDDLREKGISYSDCVQEPFCSSIQSLTNKCLVDNKLPEPPVSVEPTDPPDFVYPADCSDCEFLSFMELGNVSNGLVISSESDGNDKYYVTLSCQCTPTINQLAVTDDVLKTGNSLEFCALNRCEEVSTISSNC